MTSEPNANLSALERTQKLLALAMGIIFGLSALIVFLWGRSPGQVSLDDPEVAKKYFQELMSLGDGFYDSHPDPDVAKVLQPNMEGIEYFGGITLETNTYGVRERDWTLRKPEGTLRVVILGDSFVLGSGINADQRMGYHLERFLKQRIADFEGEVEVLQIGMGSWNIRAECAYARRQLSLLKPDLIIHILINNDLDDTVGVRGFGAFATMSPQQPDRVTGILQRRYPKQALRGAHPGWLSNGLDWESRSRFQLALQDLKNLQAAVVAQGGKYQILFAWGKNQPAAHYGLGQHFSENDTSYMSPHFGRKVEHRVSKTDGHWGPLGNQEVAKMLFALIDERSLLPGVRLNSWEGATDLMHEYFGRGREEATKDRPIADWLDDVPIGSELQFGKLNDAQKAQIHGGIAANGRVFPYGSMIIALKGNQLEIDGRGLPRPELLDPTVQIYLDELLIETVQLEPGKSFQVRATIPDEFSLREFASLRFRSNDYVYIGSSLRDCVSFRLERVAVRD